jgi:hypothetical protein
MYCTSSELIFYENVSSPGKVQHCFILHILYIVHIIQTLLWRSPAVVTGAVVGVVAEDELRGIMMKADGLHVEVAS